MIIPQTNKVLDEEPDFDRGDDLEDEEDKQKSDDDNDDCLQQDELKILGGRGSKKTNNKEWIESSIRQSVAEWKSMLNFNKENHNNNQMPSWID